MPGPKRRTSQAQAADALVAVAALAGRWIERLMARHDPPLSMAQYLALRAIAEDGVSGGALARRAGVSGPAVSQLVATLAAASWIEREPSATDRRLHVLSLSPSGRQLLRSVDRMLRAEVASLLAGVPAPEVDALARALPAVEALLSGHEPPRRPPPPGPPGRGPRPPRPSGRRR